MNGDFEEMYLSSEQAIKDGDLIRAKQLIEHMLAEDPTSAIVHNSMGWFYRVQFEDYKKAEMHYKAAIKFNPDYPHAYWNYAFLLQELERYGDLESLMNRCLSVPAINKSLVYNQLAEMHELQQRFERAVRYYKEAIKRSVKSDQIDQYWESIKRCEEKIALDAEEEPEHQRSADGATGPEEEQYGPATHQDDSPPAPEANA